MKDLVAGGLSSVTGTVEIGTERTPSVEEGVPVAISGRVLEKESGAPVPDAAVILHSAFYLRRTFYDHELVEVARAVTGPDGEFLIGHLNVDPIHFGRAASPTCPSGARTTRRCRPWRSRRSRPASATACRTSS